MTYFNQALKNIFHGLQAFGANVQYGFPQRKLKIIGVTGTDGKTTTTQLIYHILKTAGLKTGYLSTISAKIGDQELDTGLHVTTPDPWEVPRYLTEMVKGGMEYVVMESTSSGLVQNRLWGVNFIAAAITNIRSDHLDYHGSWENYAKAKYLLVKKIQPGGLIALNADDSTSAGWLSERLQKEAKNLEVKWYTKNQATINEATFHGYKFTYQGQAFELPLIGAYNLENALAAITVTAKFLSLEQISNALKTFPTPTGRMEVLQKKPYTAIVDFAHTPHALEAALSTLNGLKEKNSRIISVFGCAGKRDKDRRHMGAVSAKLADITILTSEDPRDEKLKDINLEIYTSAQTQKAELLGEYDYTAEWQGANVEALAKKCETALANALKPLIMFNEDTVNSRTDAIDCAVKLARPGDIVFITGKAHEQSMAFGETEFPWDDKTVLAEAIAANK